MLQQAHHTFELILEASDRIGIDAERDGDSLSITTDNGIYLLNYHGVTHQVWYASPQSGAHHFAWKDGTWASTREDISLHSLLHHELGLPLK